MGYVVEIEWLKGGEAVDAGGSPRGAGGEVPLRTHGGSEGAACKAWCG